MVSCFNISFIHKVNLHRLHFKLNIRFDDRNIENKSNFILPSLVIVPIINIFEQRKDYSQAAILLLLCMKKYLKTKKWIDNCFLSLLVDFSSFSTLSLPPFS